MPSIDLCIQQVLLMLVQLTTYLYGLLWYLTDLDEGIISVNNKLVKVTLPSFTTSNEHLVSTQYREEDCKIYGGEYYNIANR